MAANESFAFESEIYEVAKGVDGFWTVLRKEDGDVKLFGNLEAAIVHLCNLPVRPKKPELRLVKNDDQ